MPDIHMLFFRRNAFDLSDPIQNPLVECEDQNQMDLMMWKHQDQVGIQINPPFKHEQYSGGSNKRTFKC